MRFDQLLTDPVLDHKIMLSKCSRWCRAESVTAAVVISGDLELEVISFLSTGPATTFVLSDRVSRKISLLRQTKASGYNLQLVACKRNCIRIKI